MLDFLVPPAVFALMSIFMPKQMFDNIDKLNLTIVAYPLFLIVNLVFILVLGILETRFMNVSSVMESQY